MVCYEGCGVWATMGHVGEQVYVIPGVGCEVVREGVCDTGGREGSAEGTKSMAQRNGYEGDSPLAPLPHSPPFPGLSAPGPAGPYWGPHLGVLSKLTAGTPCLVPAHHYHCHPLLEHSGEGLG